MASSSRKTELQWLNLAFCAMVLGSHCSAHPITHLQNDSWQFALVYLLQRLSFVSVYGFFLLSGIKLTLPRQDRPTVLQYYRRRIRTIFLPYLIAVIIYYCCFSLFLGAPMPSLEEFVATLLSGTLSSPFYFITALAQFILLMPLLRYLAEHNSPVFVLPLALGISWCSELYFEQFLQLFDPSIVFPYADRVFPTYLFYYLAGCYIGQRYQAFISLLKRNRSFLIGTFLFFAVSELILSYRSKVLHLWSPVWPIAHFLYLLAAISFCFLVAASIDRPLPKWLSCVERASFLVYLYHALAITLLDAALVGTPFHSVGFLYAIRLAVVYLVVPLICITWQQLYSFAKRTVLKLAIKENVT